MKKLIAGFLFIYSMLIQSGTDKIVGTWVSEPTPQTGEIITYEFQDDDTMKMYYDGNELPAKEDITYRMTQLENLYKIEIEYVSAWNNMVEKIQGLIEFIDDDEIRMDLFLNESDEVPDNFSNESLVFQRE